MTTDKRSAEEISLEIAGIELPDKVDLTAGVSGEVVLPPPPDYQADIPQVITVGSQISEFAKGVPVELRPAIANCFLLAQLAADKWVAEHETSDETWYKSYVSMLRKIGWLAENDQTALTTVRGDGLRVHQEIITVLTAALGPVVSAASIVLGVLKGLQGMEKDQPFFTIFDRASRHAEAQLFQISYVTVGPDKAPRINIASYRIEANASATQILFFKFAGSNAKVLTSNVDISISETRLSQIKDAIEAKVSDRIAGNIAEIEI